MAKTVHGNKHLQCLLVECAWGATRKKDCYLKRKYLSLIGRRGKKKALVAVGHKIIIAAYYILKNKQGYTEPELKLKSERKKQKKQIKNYLNKLENLGIQLDRDYIISSFENKGRFFTEEVQNELSRL